MITKPHHQFTIDITQIIYIETFKYIIISLLKYLKINSKRLKKVLKHELFRLPN